MKRIAQTVSWVFLPLFMPIYALLVVMYIPSSEKSFFQENTLFFLPNLHKNLILGVYFLFSVLVPGLSLLIMRRNNRISSIEIDDRTERTVPIVITAAYCALLGIVLLVKVPGGLWPQSVYALPWGGFIAILLAGFLNRFEKISLHALGAGMLFGFLVSYYQHQVIFLFFPLIFAALIGGVVMSARMYLGKHSLRESLSGFVLGALCVYLVLENFPHLA